MCIIIKPIRLYNQLMLIKIERNGVGEMHLRIVSAIAGESSLDPITEKET